MRAATIWTKHLKEALTKNLLVPKEAMGIIKISYMDPEQQAAPTRILYNSEGFKIFE